MPSPIDDLYQLIFGDLPKKAGTAFERLAAIATFVEKEAGNVTHDAALKGAGSGSNYQIDVLHQVADETTMGEAKDYSYRGGKVGRADLQKLAGALLDLPAVDRGVFWSATNYTNPAKRYAKASREMLPGKEILLRGLRESTPEDEQGFVKTIRVRGTYTIPKLHESNWTTHWTAEGYAKLLALIPEGQNSLETGGIIDDIFDAGGNPITSIFELTSKGYGVIGEDKVARACYWLPGHYVQTNGILVPIYGIEYEVPHEIHVRTFEITDDSTYRFVVLDENNAAVRILTDENLRKFSFDAAGQLIVPPRSGGA